MELVIPPRPRSATGCELTNLGMEIGGPAVHGLASRLKNDAALHRAESLVKTTLLKLIGQLTRRRHGQDRPAYQIQLCGPVAVAVKRRTTVLDEAATHGICAMGEPDFPASYLKRFLFAMNASRRR